MPKAITVVPFPEYAQRTFNVESAGYYRNLALEALSTLGDVDESTLEFEHSTSYIAGELTDVLRFRAEVTPIRLP